MNLTTQIVRCLHNQDRWEAALVIDGEPTTFTCSHSHQTQRAADKCLKTVWERATDLVQDPEFRQVEINDDGLVEWRVTASLAPNRPDLFDSVRLYLHRNFA